MTTLKLHPVYELNPHLQYHARSSLCKENAAAVARRLHCCQIEQRKHGPPTFFTSVHNGLKINYLYITIKHQTNKHEIMYF